MKKVLYTVCSANHLAHCKTMTNAFLKFHNDYEIIIGLTDRNDGRFDNTFFEPCSIIEAEQLAIPDFKEMANNYTVIELNCAMKVFMAQYIFKSFNPDILLYLDSDIDVMHSMYEIELELADNDILITPHFISPLPDSNLLPRERDILRSGLYNAGFMAYRKSPVTEAFIKWWASHMKTECFYNFAEGMGVDQIWLNLLPLFFQRVGIWQNPGANVAYWNLHERILTKQGDSILINKKYPLLFLHISGYRFNTPDNISLHQNRFSMSEQPVLSELLNNYRNRVMANGFNKFSEMQCVFSKSVKKSKGIMKMINKFMAPFQLKIIKSN